MAREPWYKVVKPRTEVREGRSFSPDEFAIALEQVVAGSAPIDYRDPASFFSRTCFTRALKDLTGMVLRRLAGETQNTSPVLTLVTQFGGGKTHTLTALYHLAKSGQQAALLPGVSAMLEDMGIAKPPDAKVGVFVGNAWDPTEGRETPWIDLAWQLAGEQGVAALGPAAKTTPPGTEAIGKMFAAADMPVLLLFDEVLNFVNRHRDKAESFIAYIQNLTVAVTGRGGAAAVISLPRSQVEMTDWDSEWQDRITKVVRRVAKDLIANDEAEIGDVVRRRLFDDLGPEKIRRRVSKAYADWCFERTARLPPEWMAVDSASTDVKAREFLRNRFEACYPFHPSALSVFRRKWSALAQFQQTRGTLAMLAQWVSWASRQYFQQARTEPLITLGSAPLHVPDFRAVVLGQLGEQRLDVAIEADLVGPMSHAHALDVDTKGPLRDIHRRVGAAILFESSGGQVDKVAHLPELRFALGEPEVETTSVDNAAAALEEAGFFLRKVGTDGFRIHYQATLKKVVNDRRAALDEEAEVQPAIRKIVREEFSRDACLPIVAFPEDGTAIQDTPRLTLVVVDPELVWQTEGKTAQILAQWTKQKGSLPRLYPASLVWCIKKPGRDLRDRVEFWLAWKRVRLEMEAGQLGHDYSPSDHKEAIASLRTAEAAARDEVWGGYRFVALHDAEASDGIKLIDLGAGHSSASESLSSRVVTALKSEALLSQSVGAGYIERHWPPAFKETAAWPLVSLRQSFLNCSLTRLIDPDTILRQKIVEFVMRGDFGLASGAKDDGMYARLWFAESMGAEEVAFEADLYLISKARCEEIQSPNADVPQTSPNPDISSPAVPEAEEDQGNATDGDQPTEEETDKEEGMVQLSMSGTVPPELWNRLGMKVVPKLRSSESLSIGVDFKGEFNAVAAATIEAELRVILSELELEGKFIVKRS